MGIEFQLVGQVIRPLILCDVCKTQIRSDIEGIVLAHHTHGLVPARFWFAHRRCMGPCTASLSIESFISRLAESVCLTELSKRRGK